MKGLLTNPHFFLDAWGSLYSYQKPSNIIWVASSKMGYNRMMKIPKSNLRRTSSKLESASLPTRYRRPWNIELQKAKNILLILISINKCVLAGIMMWSIPSQTVH